MKVIITGATGLLGGWLVSDLIEESYDVTVIRYVPKINYQASKENPRLKSQYHINNFSQKTKEVFLDLCDFSSVEKMIKEEKADAVIHMAAVSRVSVAKNNPKDTYELASNGTLNILEAIRLHSPKTIFICHTEHKIYSGNTPPFNEDMLFNPEFMFVAAKISKEYLTKIYSKSYGIKGVTVRGGTYFGGYDFNFHKVIPYAISCLLKNEKIILRSSGRISRDFLYVKDAVLINRMLIKLMTDSSSSFQFGEAYNFSLGEDISLEEVVRKISDIYGNEAKIETVGGGHLLYGSSEMPHIRLDCKKAKDNFNWVPKYSFEQGLTETIDFYKSYFLKKS
tara:strand:+ start:221 stop:1231 length:1011 start_codon:yes stop_codon:yes gene_type:complete